MISLFLVACSAPEEIEEKPLTTSTFTEEERRIILRIQPVEAAPVDTTNEVHSSPEAIRFGEELFFSTVLSDENGVACSSCHDPNKGWSDGNKLSLGVDETLRHSPSLWGVGHQRWFLWDGNCDTMWCQAMGPLEKDTEMGSDRVALTRDIARTHWLRSQYESIFGPLPAFNNWPDSAKPIPENPEDSRNIAWESMSSEQQQQATEVLVNIAKSLAAYEATIIPPRAPIDDFVELFAEDEEAALASLTDAQENGLRLFVGDGQCHFCHTGPLLTNFEFHNLGLQPPEWAQTEDLGRYDGITAVQSSPFAADGEWSADPTGEKASRTQRLVQGYEQVGQFKTPTLRQLTETAPYMHSGQFNDLYEVVEFYAFATDLAVVGHKEELLTPRNWTEIEVHAVVSFLEMLSGTGN